ncbi:MAG: TetR/AcrR family transcriptional regulator [Brevundimonas sp.]|uniref:TetR/AcrR family transcriptional regulator n=1 Tax=Brevundimonas sp. TaxID=1871086 RepID=UPI00271A4A1F|nr:TetR/AcrR family transcriptional regulator [Brevundimonas sp.]MDO9077645.1 TetR/AcrR family transcriptional regulator [Brevundimonas sp.]MDP3079506.1 TetR/AcrR family transcriptional regulator [Brevundimonas sp.]MDZ4060712.1 TetR/AcrR family transcriptional regulator [Brevundimonas sp.]
MTDGVASGPAQRTRSALFNAFVELVLERRYQQLRVSDIIARARVGRSTFYEHYDSKDHLLRDGLAGPFGVLANIVTDRHDDERLKATILHFWQNRRVGNALLAGPTRNLAFRTLADLIEQRLAGRVQAPAVSTVLLAAQLAGGQIALLSAWMAGRAPASVDAIADALRRSAQATTLSTT